MNSKSLLRAFALSSVLVLGADALAQDAGVVETQAAPVASPDAGTAAEVAPAPSEPTASEPTPSEEELARKRRKEARRQRKLEEEDSSPSRKGFTLELGIGLGYTAAFGPSASTFLANRMGLAPLSISLGGFLNPDLALMFRASGTSYFVNTLGTLGSNYMNGFYGAVVQYFLNDRFFLSGGMGFGLFGNPYDFSLATNRPLVGFALNARAGFNFVTLKHHAFAVTVELVPGFYRNVQTLGSSLNLQWQYH